jgi:4'-phosphopantetheinyl transferase
LDIRAILFTTVIEGVHIWRAALDDAGWAGPGRLPPAERERAAGFLREDVRRRWVASRWALRRALAQYLDQPAAAIAIEEDDRGKPRLAVGAGPRFNLSHSQGLALVAVADREVGIDLEAICPGRDLLALAERALPPQDVAAVRVAAPEEQPAIFYGAWTRLEARLKCLGAGFGGRPPQAPVAVEEVGVAPGYAAAVAVTGDEVGPIRCRSLLAG